MTRDTKGVSSLFDISSYGGRIHVYVHTSMSNINVSFICDTDLKKVFFSPTDRYTERGRLQAGCCTYWAYSHTSHVRSNSEHAHNVKYYVLQILINDLVVCNRALPSDYYNIRSRVMREREKEKKTYTPRRGIDGYAKMGRKRMEGVHIYTSRISQKVHAWASLINP